MGEFEAGMSLSSRDVVELCKMKDDFPMEV